MTVLASKMKELRTNARFWDCFLKVLFACVAVILLYGIYTDRIKHQNGHYQQINCEATFSHLPAMLDECMAQTYTEFSSGHARLPAAPARVPRPDDMPPPPVAAISNDDWPPRSMDVLNAITDALKIVQGYERAAQHNTFFSPNEASADLFAVQSAIDAGKALGRWMGKEMAPLKLEEYGRVSHGSLPKERLHYLVWTLEHGKNYIEPVTHGKLYQCGAIWGDERNYRVCLWKMLDVKLALQVADLVAECGQWEDRDTSAPCQQVMRLEDTALTTIQQLQSLSSLLQP